MSFLDYDAIKCKWAANANYDSDSLISSASRYADEVFFRNAATQDLLYKLVRVDIPDLTLIDTFATESSLTAALAVHTTLFTDCLLYTLAGTNYYFRWSEPANTYVVTGVPINE